MIIDIELGEFAKAFSKYATKPYKTYISHNDCTYVLQSVENLLNTQYCIENGIEVLQTNHRGGTIVLSPGSIGFARLDYDASNTFSNKFIEAILKFLQTKGLDATYDGNDVLIDGKYKPIGNSKIVLPNGIVYHAMIFSSHVDLNLINNICTKPAIKIPVGLEDFGVSMQELRHFICEFVDKYTG